MVAPAMFSNVVVEGSLHRRRTRSSRRGDCSPASANRRRSFDSVTATSSRFRACSICPTPVIEEANRHGHVGAARLAPAVFAHARDALRARRARAHDACAPRFVASRASSASSNRASRRCEARARNCSTSSRACPTASSSTATASCVGRTRRSTAAVRRGASSARRALELVAARRPRAAREHDAARARRVEAERQRVLGQAVRTARCAARRGARRSRYTSTARPRVSS